MCPRRSRAAARCWCACSPARSTHRTSCTSAGRYGLKPRLPATPGFEGVGVVEATGGGLLGWLRKGKRVAVINDRIGNWAEYTVTKARQVVPVPDDLSDEQAATFFVNPATAIIMTRDVLRVPPGEWLLQSAAGGELGKMVIRLGKKYGFRTLNVVRRREQVEELKELGGGCGARRIGRPLSRNRSRRSRPRACGSPSTP